ncbi:response regulator [Motilimonas cestriensis]|uniref:histidine kinase n=1 Tax=Motilimonas cestriensis TaxID=2742685 RepID=A0ABS8WBA0_9GAMM|nr:ATP-binding protein [Motilimonas cestriensis]MCE2595798.1 response regulator [Motilimonas cestriensis]
MSKLNNLHWVAMVIFIMAITLVFQGVLLSNVNRDYQASYYHTIGLLEEQSVDIERALTAYAYDDPSQVKQAIVSAMSLKGLKKIIILNTKNKVIFANNSIWLNNDAIQLIEYIPNLALSSNLYFRKQFLLSEDESLLFYTKAYDLPFSGPLSEVRIYFEYEFLEPESPFWQYAKLSVNSTSIVLLILALAFIAWFYRATLMPLRRLSYALQSHGRSKERLQLDEQGVAQIRRITRLFNNIHHRQTKARQQVQEQLKQHLAIFSAIADGVILLNEKGHVLALNPAACRLFQGSETSLLGCHLSQFPGHARQLAGVLKRVQQDGLALDFADQLTFMFDSSIVHITGKISRLDAPNPQYLVCLQDTSAKQYLETAIATLSDVAATADPLQHICNSVANALKMPWVYILRREAGSERLYLLSGCQGQQFAGQSELAFSPLYELFHQGEILVMGEKINQAFASDPFIKEHHIKTFLAMPLHDEKGAVSAALCAMHYKKYESTTALDLLRIAARRVELEMQYKAQDKQLRASDTSLRQLLDNVPHMVSIRNQQHKIQLENLAARQFRHQLTEQQVSQLTAQSVVLAEKVRQGETLREIRKSVDKEGLLRFHEVVCAPYHQINSSQEMTLEVATDVTELMQAKTTLQKKVNILDALNEVHRILVMQEDESQLLLDICQILAKKLNFPLVWAGQVKDDAVSELTLIAAFSQIEQIDAFIEENCLDDLSIYRAAVRSQHVQRLDNLAEQMPSSANHQLVMMGLKSLMVVPILRNEHVTQVICVYGSKSYYFDQDDELIFNQLGLDLSLAIEHQQTAASKRQLELQLMQTQKMEAIGQLTAGVAHDFNNILASILGFTELSLMRVSLEDEKVGDYLKQVITAGKRAQDLVAQMLAFSRPNEQFHQAAVPLTLAMALKEGCRMLNATLSKEINLEFEVGYNANQTVAITPTEFHQVLMNLVINARDAMNGEGTIKVNLDHVTDSGLQECRSCRSEFQGEFLVLSVADHGSGMEEAVVRNIFSPFYTTKEVGKGTGMGLSVIHGLVHNLGGHIQVTSSPGQGSLFQVYFPVSKNLVVPIEIPVSSVTKYPSLRNKRVLLVDDESSILEFLTDLLTAAEVSVSSYKDGQSALAAFMAEPHSFDLVVTDVMMPKMTGLELAQHITQHNALVPVVAISGDDMSHYGGDDQVFIATVEKPFSSAKFMRTLADLFTPVSA